MSGSEKITCQSNGQWDGEALQCAEDESSGGGSGGTGGGGGSGGPGKNCRSVSVLECVSVGVCW